jgi:hypothetical protein
LRVALQRSPEEIALLNPEVRAREEARSDAEFQNFFAAKSAQKHD